MGALTNWYGQERQWHIGYFDVMQIIDFHLQPGQPPTWHRNTACQFGTPEAPGDLTTWLTFDPATQPAAMQHIAFVDNSGTVQALFQNPSVGWSLDPVTATSGSPALPDALTSWVLPPAYSTQHVAYIDSRGHVEEVSKVLGQDWGIRDVTDDIRASSSGSGPHWAQAGALTYWLSFGDGLHHIAYIDQRGHIQDCYMHPGQYPWGSYDVTDDTGTPAQAGALTSWWAPGDPDHGVPATQHIAYIDGRGHVLEVYVQPGVPPWNIRDVTDDIRASSGGSGPHWAQAGALTTWLSAVDGLQHIAYIDQRGHIQDCYMHPGQYPWGSYDVTDDTGTPAQAGALTSWWFVGDGTQHIAYIDANTNVLEAFVQPGKPPWQTRTVL